MQCVLNFKTRMDSVHEPEQAPAKITRQKKTTVGELQGVKYTNQIAVKRPVSSKQSGDYLKKRGK